MLNPLNLLTTELPTTIVVNAPIEKVFDYLATFRRYQEWEQLSFTGRPSLGDWNFRPGLLGANTVFEVAGSHTVHAAAGLYGISPGVRRVWYRREMTELVPHERIVFKTDSGMEGMNRTNSSTTISLVPTSTGCRIAITNRDVPTWGHWV